MQKDLLCHNLVFERLNSFMTYRIFLFFFFFLFLFPLLFLGSIRSRYFIGRISIFMLQLVFIRRNPADGGRLKGSLGMLEMYRFCGGGVNSKVTLFFDVARKGIWWFPEMGWNASSIASWLVSEFTVSTTKTAPFRCTGSKITKITIIRSSVVFVSALPASVVACYSACTGHSSIHAWFY